MNPGGAVAGRPAVDLRKRPQVGIKEFLEQRSVCLDVGIQSCFFCQRSLISLPPSHIGARCAGTSCPVVITGVI